MDDETRVENEHFENEVRRIARELWPTAFYAGADKIDGRETDGIFETDENVHILEATTSRKLEKALEDGKKVSGLVAKFQKRIPTKGIKGWFITRDEPTVDQKKAIEKFNPPVTAISFSHFQSLLIDSKAYISLRDKYRFGSVKDPATGEYSPTVDFIELMLSEVGNKNLSTPDDIVQSLIEGGRVILLGDFGAGKSMTLRYLYQKLRAEHLKGNTAKFPVFINLRDHYGQDSAVEVLERHARNIAFPNPSHLVRAWRAGFVHLLVDGFDEITTLNIQGLWKKLRDNRFRAMEAVRRLIRDHQSDAGLVISGRAHFFDSVKEMRETLGLSTAFVEYSLTEFSDEQVKEYLKRSGLTGTIPQWLPSRPLLVAYLAARGLLSDLVLTESSDPAMGWDMLLDNIASRDSEIEAGIDGGTIRQILERLSTKARATSNGLGPISPDMLIASFREICGYSPDERGMVLLQRLPGLGSDREAEGNRAFIDEDFADACRAGDIHRFIESPYDTFSETVVTAECTTGALGISIATTNAKKSEFSDGKINAALRRSSGLGAESFSSDITRVLIEKGSSVESSVRIIGVLIRELEFTKNSGDSRNVEFCDCFFSKLGIDAEVNVESLPRFKSCFFDEIDGRISRQDLPESVFNSSCIFESFTGAVSTTDAVLALDLPLGVRVVITILKKLYQRKGSGRRENALFRGLDHHARRISGDALDLIQREGLASSCKRGEDTIWLPDRNHMRRVGKILSAPQSCKDPIIVLAEEIE